MIAAGLTSIARYQAASWMNEDLWSVDWLRKGGAFDAADCLAWIYDPDHWTDYSKRLRFQFLPPHLRDRDLLLKAHTTLRRDWLRREPWALGHGDAHFGQLYTLPNGRGAPDRLAMCAGSQLHAGPRQPDRKRPFDRRPSPM